MRKTEIFKPHVARLLLGGAGIVAARSVGRQRTCDVAFAYNMPGGFAGDVNRGHPASILPNLVDPDNPPTTFGQAVVASALHANTVRAVLATDDAIDVIFGVTVRPYPFQPATAVNYGATGFGGGAPALVQPVDVMTVGYILVPVVGAPIKGGRVWLWTDVSGGGHTVGGFEAASTPGQTAALSENYLWNSPADANGLAELKIVV